MREEIESGGLRSERKDPIKCLSGCIMAYHHPTKANRHSALWDHCTASLPLVGAVFSRSVCCWLTFSCEILLKSCQPNKTSPYTHLDISDTKPCFIYRCCHFIMLTCFPQCPRKQISGKGSLSALGFSWAILLTKCEWAWIAKCFYTSETCVRCAREDITLISHLL